MAWWRDVLIKLFRMSVVKFFVCCWKFSNFRINSWVLKVLAHEKSDEIQKKLKYLSFVEWWRDILFKLSQDERCAKIWVLLKFSIFGLNFVVLKVLAHEKSGQIQKKLKSLILMALWTDVLIKLSQNESCAIFWVLLEIFNFWSKFLSLRGVSPRKEWRNPKKLKYLIFKEDEGTY
jgi:hypothetical protein